MKKGVVLSTTGSPKNAKKEEIKIFLKNFLSDKRVVKIPKPLLFFILLLRPYIIKKHYEKILINGETPLNYYLKQIKEKLQKEIPHIKIEIGNLYSKPYLKETIKNFLNSGINKIYLLPLYPQESPATTGNERYYFEKMIEEEKFEGLIFPAYWRHSTYTKIMKDKIENILKKEKMENLIFSYHGLPEIMEGSLEYKNHCIETTELITKDLNFDKKKIITSFQSRFGFLKWLKPYTKEVLKMYGKKNIKKVCIISPSFPLDCLETSYEINIKLRKTFLENGGEKFIYIEALNDSQEHINFLKDFILKNIL